MFGRVLIFCRILPNENCSDRLLASRHCPWLLDEPPVLLTAFLPSACGRSSRFPAFAVFPSIMLSTLGIRLSSRATFPAFRRSFWRDQAQVNADFPSGIQVTTGANSNVPWRCPGCLWLPRYDPAVMEWNVSETLSSCLSCLNCADAWQHVVLHILCSSSPRCACVIAARLRRRYTCQRFPGLNKRMSRMPQLSCDNCLNQPAVKGSPAVYKFLMRLTRGTLQCPS